MLEAKKNRLFENVFSIYNRNLLKRRFNSLQVSGLEYLLEKQTDIPLIIYGNHSSWWDGLIAFQISRQANLDSYFMMEEKQLKDLFLFRYLGAFSVVRENFREAVKSIKYSAQILTENPTKTIWIFPQGEILPNDLRPIFFYNGLSKIVEKVGKCSVAPLSIRYEFLGKFKPDIFVKIRETREIDVNQDFKVKEFTNLLSTQMTDSLDALKDDIITGNLSKYHSII